MVAPDKIDKLNIAIVNLNAYDFFRLVLEKKETLGVIFKIPNESSQDATYIAFGEPIRIGKNFFARIFITKWREIYQPYITINDDGNLIEIEGLKEPHLIYASVIRIKGGFAFLQKIIKM